ncbi:MAG TPA: hypothetical protein VF598_12320, partial [Hymenobacter sp.]
MKSVFIVFILLFISALSCTARNKVAVDLAIRPGTHTFSCRYTLEVAASDQLLLNLDRNFKVESVTGARVRTYTSTLFYDGFQKDTLRRLAIQFASIKARQTITVQYTGTISKRYYADSVAEFTAQAAWVPNIPDREYDLVDYSLVVRVPADYQVVSTHEPRSAAPGRYTFMGTGPNIEIGAIAARRFTRLASADNPGVVMQKANRPVTAIDTRLLGDASKIIAYQNKIIGSKDPIRRFTF